MKEVSYKKSHTIWLYVYEMPRIDKSRETERKLMVGRDWAGAGAANRYGVSFQDNENILELDSSVVTWASESTKNFTLKRMSLWYVNYISSVKNEVSLLEINPLIIVNNDRWELKRDQEAGKLIRKR